MEIKIIGKQKFESEFNKTKNLLDNKDNCKTRQNKFKIKQVRTYLLYLDKNNGMGSQQLYSLFKTTEQYDELRWELSETDDCVGEILYYFTDFLERICYALNNEYCYACV